MNFDFINFVLLTAVKYAAVIPFFAMCTMPVADKCKFKHKSVLVIVSLVFVVISLVLGFLKYYYNIRLIFVLPILLAITYILYSALYVVPLNKRFYIFISSMALFSFSSLISYIFEAYVTGKGMPNDLQKMGLLVQWSIVAVLLFIVKLFLPKIKWLLKSNKLNSVWNFVWFVPMMFVITNIIIIPLHYCNVFVGRIFQIYIIIIPVFFILFVLFQIMLYTVAKTITEKVRVQQQSQILSIQAKEYGNLKKYIETTSRLRHDFLHTARTAVELAKNNENQAMIKLLEEYGVSLDASYTQKIFCENIALNAIVGYYYDEATKNHIKCDWKIFLSNEIGILDTDLCSVVGNLLNNAIQGCMTIPKETRIISFKVDVDKNSDVYIVVTNSFNGIVNKKENKYFTTKKYGHGLGLTSITSIVDKYDGYVRFYNDSKNFYTDIMMKQNNKN